MHIEKAQRSKKIRIQCEITERVAVTEGKGQKSFTKRKTGECFQWKANGSCSKGDSCSFPHSHASGSRETSAEGAKNTGVSSLKPLITSEGGKEGQPISQRKAKRLFDLRIFSHVPSQPARIPSPRSVLSCDKRLQPETWNLSGLQENVFANPRSRFESSQIPYQGIHSFLTTNAAGEAPALISTGKSVA